MSQKVKEILQIVAFFVIVGSLLTFYVIYPLNRSKAYFARTNLDQFNPDTLAVNDPSFYLEAGLTVDSLRIDADALTSLACFYVHPTGDSSAPRGSIGLIADDNHDRGSMLPLVKDLADTGFNVIIYDQRATGASGGRYHGEGQLEAGDLEELVAYLDLRHEISHPFAVVGYNIGADAALLAEEEETRIDGVIAIDPYLTTERMLSVLRQKNHGWPVPFFKTVLWFWYGMRSGYDTQYRKTEDISGISRPTLLLCPEATQDSREIQRLKELSDPALLTVGPLPEPDKIKTIIIDFIEGLRQSTVSTQP